MKLTVQVQSIFVFQEVRGRFPNPSGEDLAMIVPAAGGYNGEDMLTIPEKVMT